MERDGGNLKRNGERWKGVVAEKGGKTMRWKGGKRWWEGGKVEAWSCGVL
jgi:hypothetical protein